MIACETVDWPSLAVIVCVFGTICYIMHLVWKGPT